MITYSCDYCGQSLDPEKLTTVMLRSNVKSGTGHLCEKHTDQLADQLAKQYGIDLKLWEED